MKRTISIVLTLGLVLAFSLVVATPVAAQTTYYVATTGLDTNPGTSGNPWLTIQHAVSTAASGDTIMVAAGTYVETGQIVINKNLTITGADKTTTIIEPAQDTTNSGDGRAWFLVNDGIVFDLSNVTLDGLAPSVKVSIGILSHGGGCISDCVIQNCWYEPLGPAYAGRGIAMYDSDGTMCVQNNLIQNFGRIGVYANGAGCDRVIQGNTIIGKGSGGWLDYGIELENGATATITANTITACGTSSSGWGSGAILASTHFGPGTAATIIGNNITGNEYGICIGLGLDPDDTTVVTAHFNNIYPNAYTYSWSNTVMTDATCNWWGASDGPTNDYGPGSGDYAGGISGMLDFSSFLTEPYAPQKSVAAPGGTAYFDPDQGSIEGLTAVAPPATPPVELPYGMFNFTVCCFGGSTATLGITLPGPAPRGTKWYKYNGGAWDALSIGSDNGDAFITVTLTDNNPIHDEDPTVGYIVDQGGPGFGGTVGWETYPVSKTRVLLPWIALFVAIVASAGLLVLRRRRAQT